MKVLIIGGTGLLGSEAAKQLILRGHEVRTIALAPLPDGAVFPPEMQISFGNYMDMSDEALLTHLDGCDALVFAAGVDERVEGPKPIYDLFARYNITPLERLLRLAKQSGVRSAAICGSYFSYFAKIWPEAELCRHHPYIRSRIEQERMALSFADERFSVAILELPYIFGTQPGRKPVWMFLAKMIRRMPAATFYPRGGTAMITARQAGEALAGAIERNKGGNCYPIGYFNRTWKEMLGVMHREMSLGNRPVVTIPVWMFRLASAALMRAQRKAGLEGGLHLVRFASVMCRETYIDKSLGCLPLGVTPDDIDKAIGDSIRLCLNILDGKSNVVEMRAV